MDYDLAALRLAIERSLPIYAAIFSAETDKRGQRGNLLPERYRVYADNLWKQGFDGLELFNFFILRVNNHSDLPRYLLAELGHSETIGKSEKREKTPVPRKDN